jgi:IS5 family transposase
LNPALFWAAVLAEVDLPPSSEAGLLQRIRRRVPLPAGGWRVKHKGRTAVHGFKAHVGADADTALVEEVAVTPANVNDGKAGPDALPDTPGEVFADSACRGKTFREAVRAKGGSLRVAVTGKWGQDEAETLARLEAWNHPIHRIRGRMRRSLEPGSAATAFGACDGAGSQRHDCKSASPQSSTTSSAVPEFSPQSDRRAKAQRQSRNRAIAPNPLSAKRPNRKKTGEDANPRTGLVTPRVIASDRRGPSLAFRWI